MIAVGLFVFFLMFATTLLFKRNPFGGTLSLNFIPIVPENLFSTCRLAKYSLLGCTRTENTKSIVVEELVT